MSDRSAHIHRRRFLGAVARAGAVLAVPQIIPAAALGKDGAVAPSEKIVVGGIGIGNRGSLRPGLFPAAA